MGEIEAMVTIRRRLGDRFSYLGGLPTAEVYAAAYKALGVPVYSSAVFNFIPKTAMEFYRAIAADDHATVGKLIDEFFLPYLAIRNRRAGLRGQHREGRREAGRPRRGSGARAADRSDRRRNGATRRADQEARRAVKQHGATPREPGR